MSNDLLSLWGTALENPPDENGLVLRVKFPDVKTAAAARIELYRLRTKARRMTKKNLGPDDPNYDTSPWDSLVIRQPGGGRNKVAGEPVLEFYTTGHGRWNFEILPKEVEEMAVPKKRSKK